MDVSSLYTNIPIQDGLDSMKETFDDFFDPSVNKFHQDYLLRLLEILLSNNIFEFDGKLFIQRIGAAMGSPPIPTYANTFMAKRLDKSIFKIIELISKNENISLELFKRFLDDLFFIFIGNTKSLHKILEEINLIHPSIKFTMKHTFIN